MTKSSELRCVHCGGKIDTDALRIQGGIEQRCYPFCSERCKMIDLGNWAAGRYKIPSVSTEPVPISATSVDEREPDD